VRGGTGNTTGIVPATMSSASNIPASRSRSSTFEGRVRGGRHLAMHGRERGGERDRGAACALEVWYVASREGQPRGVKRRHLSQRLAEELDHIR
jgi:hypothetical protein